MNRILFAGAMSSDQEHFAEALRTGSNGSETKFVAVDSLSKCLQFITQARYNLVILDIELPDCGGASGVAKVRAANPYVAMIVLTSLDDEVHGLELLRAGADDYLEKNALNQRGLRTIVSYAIERKMTQISLGAQLKLLKLLSNSQTVDNALAEAFPILSKTLGWDLIAFRRPRGSDKRDVVYSAGEVGKNWRIMRIPVSTREFDFGVLEFGKQSGDAFEQPEIALIDLFKEQIREASLRQVTLENNRQLAADFVAAIVHDIKNPLVGADRILDWLGERLDMQANCETAELLKGLKLSNQGLLRLVQNLVDFYRYEGSAFPVNLVRCDVNALIEGCITEIKHHAESGKVILITSHVEQLPLCELDQNAMRRVILNLLHNAIKFTAPEGVVEISAEAGTDSVILTVRDTGRGISLQDRTLIFQRYSQGEHGQSYPGGTGLGLYVAKQFVSAHNGEIECRSELDQGSSFIITIPITKKPSAS